MGYVLESPNEADRLEYQSTLPKYNYREELKSFSTQPGEVVLDAGCGSGVVTRHLATVHPLSTFLGIDFSTERVDYAKNSCRALNNVSFRQGDLTNLFLESDSVDRIVNRYVLEHIPQEKTSQVINEFYRVLRPGGVAYLVDFDEPLLNIYPTTEAMEQVISALKNSKDMDFRVARKMPSMLSKAGFQNIEWSMQTVEVSKEALKAEMSLIPDKLELISPFINDLTDEVTTKRFIKDYVETLSRPGMTLFYNKFIAIGSK